MTKYAMAHTMVRVLDLEKSIRFYEEALGMKEKRREDVPKDEFTLVYMGYEDEDFTLELTYNYGQKEPYTHGKGYGHLAVYVDDLKESHRINKEKGFEVTPLYGLREGEEHFYFITDPDGYAVEVMKKDM